MVSDVFMAEGIIDKAFIATNDAYEINSGSGGSLMERGNILQKVYLRFVELDRYKCKFLVSLVNKLLSFLSIFSPMVLLFLFWGGGVGLTIRSVGVR